MKRAFCAFAVFFGVLFAVSAQWETRRGNGGLVITGYTGNDTVITIPARINGVAVVAIGDAAFYMTRITRVTIPSSVTSIGNAAFFGTRLTSATVPAGVTFIGDFAFPEGMRLTRGTIPAGVASAGNAAQWRTRRGDGGLVITGYTGNDTDIAIPARINGAAVVAIGDAAFYMTRITSVTIPSSVTSIGNAAFFGTRLTSATVPAGVTSIGDFAFPEGMRLIRATAPASVPSAGDAAQWRTRRGDGGLVITGYTGNDTDIAIPARINGAAVVAIGDAAFYMTRITSVTIPNSVTSIGNAAFFGTPLTSATVPAGVTSIGDLAFPEGMRLTRGTAPAGVASAGNAVVAETPSPRATAPAGVAPAGNAAVAETPSTRATIPASVSASGNSAVAETPSTRTTIPAGVPSAGNSAVAGTPSTRVTSATTNDTSPTTYTVTFNSQGGSAVASHTVPKGYTMPYPAEPVKAGVFFVGWYKESGCINPCDYAAAVSSPITLYAKWLTESAMIAGEFGASVPASAVFEVNNSTASDSEEPGWDASWAKVRAAINDGGDGKNYVVKVTGDFQLEGSSSTTFTPSNIKVLIYAPANKTISGSDDLYAGASQTLILRNITLQGRTGCNANAHLIMRPGAVITKNTLSGVYVEGGTFTMSGGTISGNAASYGGGVDVSGGAFTMSGGTIGGNSASNGGGVYVSGGTFTMEGGAVGGNSASSFGGGVYVEGGAFTMSGGTVGDNSASSSGGGGVYVAASGAFTMSGGTIGGNSAVSTAVSSSGGGGVRVAGGAFTMNGGSIGGNAASGNGGGGGVYVNSGGTFTMRSGTIYGKGAGTGLANTGSLGASLSIRDTASIAKYGNDGTILGSGLATDETLSGHD